MAKTGWSPADAPSLAGRTAVVTGANSGIGMETARALTGLGASVVLACRNTDAAKAAREQILAEFPQAGVDVVPLDLSSLESVRTAAEDVRGRVDAIDLLVANAGVMASRHTLTADGFELDFGTNFLGHFAFVGLLCDRILAADAARVVTVGSHVARAGAIDFDDMTMARRFTGARAYSRSKYAQMVFAMDLQRRLTATGARAISLAAHPGATRTGVMRDQNRFLRWAFTSPKMRWLLDYFVMDVDRGALPSLRAAVDPSARGGDYFGPSGPFEFSGAPVLVAPPEHVGDRAVARRLWTTAQELTGVTYLDD